MGWERKRGKLHEFNRLLRGDTATSYIVQIGDLTILPQIRYVITLDADTDPAARASATGWWARWPIRSTGRSLTPRPAR